MRRVVLGDTGLDVARICLGTVYYGLDRLPQQAAEAQLDSYCQLGGNFIDTAQVYSNWIEGETSRSEKAIGQWLKKSGMRHQMVISTKGGHPLMDHMDIPRLDEQSVRSDIAHSLDNLGCGHIDLYFLHRDDPARPVAEIVDLMETLRGEGLLDWYGFSNWTLARVKQAREYARQKGVKGFSVNQIMWSPVRVNPPAIQDQTLVPMSRAYYDFHVETGFPAMAYTSQAQGYFSKKFQGRPPQDNLERLYGSPANEDLYETVRSYCLQNRCDPARPLLQWFFSQPFPAVPIISVNDDTQLKEAMAALESAQPLPAGMPRW